MLFRSVPVSRRPVSFHFFQILSNFALCKNLSVPQMPAGGYNQIRREEEGFLKNEKDKRKGKENEKNASE